MIDLSYQKLQSEIEVNGCRYRLQTDYRYWIGLERLLKEAETTPKKLVNLFVEELPQTGEDWVIAIQKLQEFWKNPNSTPNVTENVNERILDFIEDGEYIYASFFNAYKIDLFAVKMHWHLFLALFRGLPSNSKIKEIMAMRSYVKSNKKPERRYEDAKRTWALPKEKVEDETIKEINELFWGCK